MTDTLGDRIKRYERVSNPKLLPRSPIFIRIDGKSFHTFTRGFEKPFSMTLVETMVKAAQATARQMSGFKLGYVQSDEATFMLTDTDTLTTQGWFDYELNKVVSISASAFTAHFNRIWDAQFSTNVNDDNYIPNQQPPAMFDSRAFNVPEDDAPNVFIWRQRDWQRNSLQMLTREYFSHKECEGKKMADMHEMLYTKNLNWAYLMPQLKEGTWILPDGRVNYSKQDYESIVRLINGDV